MCISVDFNFYWQKDIKTMRNYWKFRKLIVIQIFECNSNNNVIYKITEYEILFLKEIIHYYLLLFIIT